MRRDSNSADYYRRREAHERELAAKAALPKVGQIHLELAERHRALAMSADEVESKVQDRRINEIGNADATT
jgi:hypothetical protein